MLLLRQAAKAITGDPPPAGTPNEKQAEERRLRDAMVLEGFKHAAECLGGRRLANADAPLRGDVRGRLDAIAEAAAALAGALRGSDGQPHPQVAELLNRGPDDLDVGALLHLLLRLADRAAAAQAGVPAGGGSNRYSPHPGELSARGFCAYLVRVAARAAGVHAIDRDNPKAHEAAEALWRATCETVPTEDEPWRDWTPHLQEAARRVDARTLDDDARWWRETFRELDPATNSA